MIRAAATLIELLDPAGLLSFDFLVADERAYLLEINPRPGATLEIFDDLDGNLFRAHVEAGLGNDLWQQRNLPEEAGRAAALLYADRGALTIGEIDWPGWTADRPAPGTLIAAEQPIATVRANAATPDEAERLARDAAFDACRPRLHIITKILGETPMPSSPRPRASTSSLQKSSIRSRRTLLRCASAFQREAPANA